METFDVALRRLVKDWLARTSSAPLEVREIEKAHMIRAMADMVARLAMDEVDPEGRP